MNRHKVVPDLCAPWHVDEGIVWGTDLDGHSIRIADIRGWGALTGNPYRLESDEAAAVQDKWANLIAAAPVMKEVIELVFDEIANAEGKRGRVTHLLEPLAAAINAYTVWPEGREL